MYTVMLLINLTDDFKIILAMSVLQNSSIGILYNIYIYADSVNIFTTYPLTMLPFNNRFIQILIIYWTF